MQNTIFVRCDGKYIRINTDEIRYIESLKNYVRIVAITKSYLVLISLTQLEKELPASHFCRVHRSFIVSLHHINSFDHENVYLSDITIPINPAYKNMLLSKVKVLVSDTRTTINNPAK
jgi:DNA-binding LytR/AlgR family response regulator